MTRAPAQELALARRAYWWARARLRDAQLHNDSTYRRLKAAELAVMRTVISDSLATVGVQ